MFMHQLQQKFGPIITHVELSSFHIKYHLLQQVHIPAHLAAEQCAYNTEGANYPSNLTCETCAWACEKH